MIASRWPTWLLVSTLLAGSALADDRVWREVNHGLRHGVSLELIEVSGEDGRLVIIGDDQGYIYRSTDAGGSWQESRLTADEPSPMPIPLPRLGEVLIGGVDLFEELPDLEPPFGEVPAASPDDDAESFSSGAAEGAGEGGGLLPRNRGEDPGDIVSQYMAGHTDQLARVNWLATCETDAGRVYAATDDGVFRSDDGALSWIRVFGGANAQESSVLAVVCDERSADAVYIGTGVGFFYSFDGGVSWQRPQGQWGSLSICYIAPDPADPDRIFVGTYLGVYMTTDLDEFVEVYVPLTGSPDARATCAVEPTESDIFYVGSNDGAVVSRDAGVTFEKIAPDLLERHVIGMLWVDPTDDRHLYILTDDVFWETRDAGVSIIPLYMRRSNATLRTFALDPHDPERIWLVTSNQLLVLEPPSYQRPAVDPGDPVAQVAALALAASPPLGAVVDEVLERGRLDRASLLGRRQRARSRNALPQVAAAAWVISGPRDRIFSGLGFISLISEIFQPQSCRLPVNPPACITAARRFDLGSSDRADRTAWGAGIVLGWNLPFLEFDRAESNSIWNDILRIRQQVVYSVADYWFERARVLRELAEVSHDPHSRLALSIRVEEMNAVLDALTGGRFEFR